MSIDKPDSNGAAPQIDAAQKFRDQLYSKTEDRVEQGGIPLHGGLPNLGDYLPKAPQPDLPTIIIIDKHDKPRHPEPPHRRK